MSMDAYSSAEVTEKIINMASAKTTMPWYRQLPLTIMAGVFISCGAIFSLLIFQDTSLPYAMQRLVAGMVFSLGLSLVMVVGAELFTGNTMIVGAAVEKKISWGAVFNNLIRVWVGNAIGALIMVALVYGAHVPDVAQFHDGMINLAKAKMTPDWGTIFIKGILCNLLVCLGVWMGYAGRSVVDKVFGVMLPVAAFVALGFEHCVANMFFLPLGLLVGMDQPQRWMTLANLAKNLSAATLGNIVGGAGLILMYRFAHRHNAL